MSIRPQKPAPATPAPGKLPLTELPEMKERGRKIVSTTAYDYPSAVIADQAGVDLFSSAIPRQWWCWATTPRSR